MDFEPPEKLTDEEEASLAPVFAKLRALTANGLIGIDLICCWVEWRIMPLSRRDGLMCEYDDNLNHLQCFYNVMLAEEDIVNIVKKQCGELIKNCSKIGLKPFCVSNPAPEINNLARLSCFLYHFELDF